MIWYLQLGTRASTAEAEVPNAGGSGVVDDNCDLCFLVVLPVVRTLFIAPRLFCSLLHSALSCSYV